MNKSKNLSLILIILLLIVFIIGFFWFRRLPKTTPLSDNDNKTKINTKKPPVDTSNWIDYSNNQLGFSIKIPLEVSSVYRCPEKQEGSTPLRVFEDNQNGAVYISQEYYYDANWSQPEQKYIGECSKITYSLESLKKEEKDKDLAGFSSHPFLGWKIIINNPENESEVADFVKENFGQGCIINSKDLQENGSYEIGLMGSEKGGKDDPWWENCFLNFSYKIVYSPEKHKLMSVILGQECTFGTDPMISSSYQCYDETMIKSFKFQ